MFSCSKLWPGSAAEKNVQIKKIHMCIDSGDTERLIGTYIDDFLNVFF
jgi:hypothetical protein